MRTKILIACLITLNSCCVQICTKTRACDNSNTYPQITIKLSGFSRTELASGQILSHNTKSKELIQKQNFNDSLIDIASGKAWDLQSHYYIIKTATSYDSIHDISFELFKENTTCEGNCKSEVEKFRNLSFHNNGKLIQGDTLFVRK